MTVAGWLLVCGVFSNLLFANGRKPSKRFQILFNIERPIFVYCRYYTTAWIISYNRNEFYGFYFIFLGPEPLSVVNLGVILVHRRKWRHDKHYKMESPISAGSLQIVNNYPGRFVYTWYSDRSETWRVLKIRKMYVSGTELFRDRAATRRQWGGKASRLNYYRCT